MPTPKLVIKNHFSPSEVVKSPKGVKPAKQEFKQDADINSIMKKFQKSGAMDHAQLHQGHYGDTTGQDLQSAATIVANANSMFNDLPSSVRNKFENEPSRFLDFVQNADNQQEAYELGISLSPAATLEAAEAAEAAETNPPQAGGANVGQESNEAP